MKCHDCGKEFQPTEFTNSSGVPLTNQLTGQTYAPGATIFHAGEANSEGEIWMECPDGHRGGFYAVK